MTLRNKVLAFVSLSLICVQVAAQSSPPRQTICDKRKKADHSLVWAIDISGSIDTAEVETQIQGYISALQNENIQNNFLTCQCSEVSIIAWASTSAVKTDFKTLAHQSDIEDLVQQLTVFKNSLNDNMNLGSETEILNALKTSGDVILSRQNENNAPSMTITVSGDGMNSRIYPQIIEEFRAQKSLFERSGVKVNGVPISIYRGSDFIESPKSSLSAVATQASGNSYSGVSEFYEKEVITRDGYIEKAESFEQFGEAITRSILKDSCMLMM